MMIGAANDGPLHHPVDQLAPEALLDLLAGLGLLGLLGEEVDDPYVRTSSCAGTAPEAASAHRVRRYWVRDGQRPGKHGDRQDRRQHDEAMIAYVMDFRNPAGTAASGTDDATMITAENVDSAARGHHRPAKCGLGVVALGDLLAEPAHDERPKSIAMPRPISVTTGWAKKCTGMNSASRRMMPREPAMVRPPTITGRLAAITPPNTKNSTTMTSGTPSSSPRC